jgi:hypothetical protein
MRVSSVSLLLTVAACSLVHILSFQCQTSRLPMFRAKQVFSLRRTSPPAEVSQLCGMTSNNEFQPPASPHITEKPIRATSTTLLLKSAAPFSSATSLFKTLFHSYQVLFHFCLEGILVPYHFCRELFQVLFLFCLDLLLLPRRESWSSFFSVLDLFHALKGIHILFHFCLKLYQFCLELFHFCLEGIQALFHFLP